MRSYQRKVTRESKFDRKYWCNNKGKRNFVKRLKQRNNKAFRRHIKASHQKLSP